MVTTAGYTVCNTGTGNKKNPQPPRRGGATKHQSNHQTNQSPTVKHHHHQASTEMSAAACIFCKIIRGEIPSFKVFPPHPPNSPIYLFPPPHPNQKKEEKEENPLHSTDRHTLQLLETDKILAFLDINPLSRGHAVTPPPSSALRPLPLPPQASRQMANLHPARNPQNPRRKAPRCARRRAQRAPPRRQEARASGRCSGVQHFTKQRAWSASAC